MLTVAGEGRAGDDFQIYSERRNNGWDDWSWVAHYGTNNPAHNGTNALCFAATGTFQALWFKHGELDARLYTNVTLWANGGAGGGQYLGLNAEVGGSSAGLPRLSATLFTNAWKQITFSLASLGVANATNLTGFQIWNSGTLQSNFFIDDFTLIAAPKPALVQISLLATQAIRTVDARIFAVNAAAWDGSLDTSSTIDVLTNLDNQALRWPGGSWGDGYHFTNEIAAFKARGYGCVTTNFFHIATNTRAQVFFIVNYGTAQPAEAVQWVRFCNVTNHWGVKYWEVGNENYGSWEGDNNTNTPFLAHDPWTYAMRFTNFYALMKAADPAIKIGAVVLASETAYSNNATHFAVNPRTGATNYGWTPVVLANLKSLGVTPDFLIDHEYAPTDGDTTGLLWSDNWPMLANNLRQMLTDYLGPTSTNVELTVTENGGGGDRQRTSIVGGLFFADSIGQILQTEFNARLWWDLRNGRSTIADSDPAFSGWRTNNAGFYYDEGIVYNNAEPTNRYPTFYCAKLLKYFARGGDTVVKATSDYPLLAAYAAKRTNGTLSLLVINKSSASNLTAAVKIAGYVPTTNAVVYRYGIPQDDAARTGVGSPDLAQEALTNAAVNFTNTFVPYSATVLSFNPAPPPAITVQAAAVGKFIFQLTGQSGAAYVLQNTTNLNGAWNSVATNTLLGLTINVTNQATNAQQFWRAFWR